MLKLKILISHSVCGPELDAGGQQLVLVIPISRKKNKL